MPLWSGRRLISLWEIMNEFWVTSICAMLGHIEAYEVRMAEWKQRHGEGHVEDSTIQEICRILSQLRWHCQRIGLDTSADQIRTQESHLESTQWDRGFSVIETRLRTIRITTISEMASRKFLWIASDRSEYLEDAQEPKLLFGEVVDLAFPSASRDIKEAANCLATECCTACVFHLMRVCEVALRALAKDRAVEFKDKPIKQKEWGQIVPALDAKIKEMREAEPKKWTKPETKDEQIRFYSELMPELRAFNEAWRKHISHADTEAFYDRDHALSIWNHVKFFMQRLSVKIGEHKSTPEFWN